jgi:Zn-dependent protease with chaperone function
VARRPGRTTIANVVALLAFLLYGMARVEAPVSGLGLVFDHPVTFAVVGAITAIGGAALLFVRPVELAVGRALVGDSREPTADEDARIRRLLAAIGARGGMKTERLVVRIQEDSGMNASAGASHLLFVTSGALELTDDELEPILAHELGHHRGIHPIMGAMVWWLRLPGAALAAVYHALRRSAAAVGMRAGRLGRLLASGVLIVIVVWQITVMWMYYVGELLAMRAARLSEFEADATAAGWGYAGGLAAAYRRLARRELEPQGRWARLLDEHPPLSERIDRLETWGGSPASASRVAGRG